MIAQTSRIGTSTLVIAFALCTAGSPLAAHAQNVGAKATAAPAAAVPDAVRKILDAAVEGMGGRKAIDAIESMHTKMELTVPEMGSMSSENWWHRPNKSLSKQVIPQMGEMSTGTDGSVWWRHNGFMGYQIITEKEANAAGPGGFTAEMFDMEKSLTEQYRDLTAPGAVDFDGRKCNRIQGADKEGAGSTVLYFDAQTGLPAGAETTEMSAVGTTQTSTMFLRDWKVVDKVKLFHTMEMKSGPQGAKAVVQLVEFNNVPAELFELPDEVKAMATAKPKAGPNTGAGTGERTLESFDAQQQAMIQAILSSTAQINDPTALREMVKNMSRGLSQMPQQQKEAMEYVIGKLEARIKALGG